MSAVLYKINESTDYNSLSKVFKKFYDEGKVIVYPTDTIYGLGGDPFDKNVADKIKSIKGRGEKKGFIHLISRFELLQTYTDELSDKYKFFLKNIWPDRVSVVLTLNDHSKKIFGTDKACFRIPNDRFCLAVLNGLNRPLISTSVNISGQPPLVDANKIIDNYKSIVDVIFYSYLPSKGFSSTILDLTGNEIKLIREGTLKFVELLKNLP